MTPDRPIDGNVTIVSYYCGSQYYYRCAEILTQDCQRLDLNHDIVELKAQESQNWAVICRQKIPFYREMLAKHPNGILWLDVDSRILRKPPLEQKNTVDFAAFLRGFRYLREYDPAIYSRTFHPGILYFSGSPRSLKFLDHLNMLERNYVGNATDDYFLEEGFRTFPEELSLHLFPPSYITKTETAINTDTVFVFGESGNVAEYKSKVDQHTPPIFEPRRKRQTLHDIAQKAIKSGRREDARILMREAHKQDPNHQDTALKYARLEAKSNNHQAAIDVIDRSFGKAPSTLPPAMLAIESSLAMRKFRTARARLDRLELTSPEAQNYADSRKFRLEIESRAATLGYAESERPLLWWMETPYPGNLGDILNPFIVERLSGIPPLYSPIGQGILAIGSVIKFATAASHVWGTGTPRMTDKLSPDANYRAVRGPLTRQLVERSGGRPPDIFGDPALLLPLIHNPPVKKTHRLGIIRHYTHQTEELISPDVLDIAIIRSGYSQITEFIDQVRSCEAIISSSLHGLIIAHAYGIPTRRAIFSHAAKTLPGDGTKFDDHYLALGIEIVPPVDLSSSALIRPSDQMLCVERPPASIDHLPLLSAAPFRIRTRILERANRLIVANQPPQQESPPLDPEIVTSTVV